MNYAIFPRLAYRMDKSVLVNTAMLPLSSLQRSAASLVTTHRGHFLPTSASHGFPHPCLWAGRQHFAQENTPCSFSPLERGFRHFHEHRQVTVVPGDLRQPVVPELIVRRGAVAIPGFELADHKLGQIAPKRRRCHFRGDVVLRRVVFALYARSVEIARVDVIQSVAISVLP